MKHIYGCNVCTICLLVLAFIPLACNEDAPNDIVGEFNNNLPSLNFFWIPKEFENTVFETGRVGAEQRAKELTEEGNHNVTVTCAWPESATDIESQAEFLRLAIQNDVDGVAISCNIRDGLMEAINDTVAAGIPVMTFDADSPDSSRFTYLGVDNEKGGALAARILGESMTGGTLTKVALVSGVDGAANLDARVDGFQTTIATEFPDLEIVDTVYCNDDGDLAATLIEEIFAEHPDIGGLFFVGLWPLFSCDGTNCANSMPSWDAAARTGAVKTVVFDTLEFQLDFIAAGTVSGLVGQKYWGWGYDAVQMLYDRAVDNKDFQDWTDSGIDLVCPNNYDEMAAMWGTTNFNTPLSPCEINGKIIQ